MLPIKNRLSFFYVERGALSVIDGCLVLTNLDDRVRFEVPCRATTAIMVGPGGSVTTEAVRLAAAYGTVLLWTGEHGVRCYSAGQAWSENTGWLEHQVQQYADATHRLAVARRMYERRFQRSVERRGLEGARMREFYRFLARQFNIRWHGRRYPGGGHVTDFDAPNRALNVANTCLYGLVECAVHTMGLSPALGFIHSGSQLAFVLDVADLFKTTVTIPVCFAEVARRAPSGEPWETHASSATGARRWSGGSTRIWAQSVTGRRWWSIASSSTSKR